jgi:hypothetical protein
LFNTLKSTFIKRPEVGQFDRMKRKVKFWARGVGGNEGLTTWQEGLHGRTSGYKPIFPSAIIKCKYFTPTVDKFCKAL